MDLRTAKTLSPREYHALRTDAARAAKEARRQEVLERARAAIRRLAPLHPAVRSVHLYGSILKPGRFGEASDIDIAIECDDLEAETPFARALERELRMMVDLRPLTGAVADAVAEGGEKVHG